MRWMPRRVALSIALALAPGLALVLGSLGVANALREGAWIEAEHELDARAMATSVAHVLQDHDGPAERAEERVVELNRSIAHLEVELVRLSGPGAPVPDAMLAPQGPDGSRRVVGVAAVTSGPLAGAVVVVTEPLAARDAFVRRALLVDLVGMLGAMALASVIAVVVGRQVVQRRVDAILARLAAVGRGEMSGPPLELGVDELGVLGRAVNSMVAQLVAARERAEQEGEARRTAELDLRRADRLAAVGQTAAVFAHEIGTPLNVVAGRAARIARRDGPDGDDARIVVEQAERIAANVRRLLDYARHDDERERRPVDLGSVVRESRELMAERARHGRVDLVVGPVDPAAVVLGDPVALGQIVTNLLANAVDAAPRFGCVQVAVGRQGGRVVLTVDDDGPGVPEDLRERVFDAFFTTKPAGAGTGLGLAIVRQIAREHGGDARIEASPGGGCRVRVELPPLEDPDAR